MRAVRWGDALLPLAFAVLGAVELLGLDVERFALAVAVESLACLLLVARRRWPWAASTAGGMVVLLLPYLGAELDEPAVPILVLGLASWTVARHLPDLRGVATVALFLLGIVSHFGDTSDAEDASDLVFLLIVLVPPYLAGLGARSLAGRNARLAEETAELLRLQRVVRAEAAAAERGRIARELHDVIAHSVSAMVVQASAAAELVHRDPDRARQAVEEVASTGRRALAETGRLLHLVRDEHDELGLAPDPGMTGLADLVDGFRRSGLDVDLVVEGDLDGLPAGVDLSGYRIVQEVLTNALKHAREHRTRLRVQRSHDVLRIRTDNEVGAHGGGSGLGLVGMAERVSVFGGRLSHGVGDDGRFVLEAELPVLPRDP